MSNSIGDKLLKIAKEIKALENSGVVPLAQEALSESINYIDSIAKGLMSFKKENDDQDAHDVADEILKEVSMARNYLKSALGKTEGL